MAELDMSAVIRQAAVVVLANKADEFRTLVADVAADPTEEGADALLAAAEYIHTGVCMAIRADVSGSELADAMGWGDEVIALLLALPRG